MTDCKIYVGPKVPGNAEVLEASLAPKVSFELVGASEVGIESQLIAFINDDQRAVDKTTWFSFDRLNFRNRQSGNQS
jgi:hypothetical protein